MNQFKLPGQVASQSSALTLLILLVVIAIYAFGTGPKLDQLKQVKTQTAAAKVDAAKLEKKVSALRKFKVRLDQGNGELESLRTALPADEDLPGVFVTLTAIAAKSGVVIESLAPGQTSGNILLVDLTISSGYDELISFLVNLAKNQRPISVESLSSVAAGESQDANQSNRLTSSLKLGLGFGQSAAQASVQDQSSLNQP